MIVEEQILADLNPPQLEAVKHIEGPLLVLAGAGSGKTRVITRRIGYLMLNDVNPASIVAITFTNKAADEMARRVSELHEGMNGMMPTVSTFHSFCVLLLRIYGQTIDLDTKFTIFDMGDSGKIVRQACGDIGAMPVGLTPAKAGEVISRAKTLMVQPEELPEKLNLPPFQLASLMRIYSRYEQLLKENNALDFDDLLLKTLELLKEPSAQQAIHRRYQYLLIDEYQDTNHVQYLLAKHLAAQTRNLCATGDPDQSIYGWRGAEINNILDFEKDYPDAKVVYLENNYRSTAHILDAASSLIRHNTQRKEKRLIPVLESGAKLKVHSCEDENDEARKLVELIKDAQRQGHPLSQIAVMCRVNSLFRTVEQILTENKIPYQLARGVSFFQRREIRDVMAYLRVLANPSDQVALERIINAPTRGIGAQAQTALKTFALENRIALYDAVLQAGKVVTLGKSQSNVLLFGEMMERFRSMVPTGNIESLVRTVVEGSTLRSYYQRQKEKRADELSPEANLDEFIGIAKKFDEQNPDGSLTDFLSQQSLVSDTDAIDSQTDRVILLTMHAAKGLEFDQVIVLAVEEDILPHGMSANQPSQVEEERRLFFVAITRARRQLHLCWSHHRVTRGSYRQGVPSRFLKEIDPKTIEGLDLTTLSKPARTNQFIISPPRSSDPQTPSETPGRPRCGYRPGQRVYHEKFGYGVVQEVYLNGNNFMGSIQFHNGGLKKLSLSIAPLQTVK